MPAPPSPPQIAADLEKRVLGQKEAVREIAAAYHAHIELEESELIPLAREALPADEVATIGREMAERRGVAVAA